MLLLSPRPQKKTQRPLGVLLGVHHAERVQAALHAVRQQQHRRRRQALAHVEAQAGVLA